MGIYSVDIKLNLGKGTVRVQITKSTIFMVLFSLQFLERIAGIEPATSAWEANVMPFNYIRENGADMRNRTADLFITSEPHYRLCYISSLTLNYYTLFFLICQILF